MSDRLQKAIQYKRYKNNINISVKIIYYFARFIKKITSSNQHASHHHESPGTLHANPKGVEMIHQKTKYIKLHKIP
ncbi:hypothetical protein ACK37F_19275 [Aeromonas veronii]